MNIPAFESGVIRLFAIDLPTDQIAAFNTIVNPTNDDPLWPLKNALGRYIFGRETSSRSSRSAILKDWVLLDI